LDHNGRRKSNPKLLGRLEIYDKLELRGLFDGQVRQFLINVEGGVAEDCGRVGP
jgi:hypothetical protein